MWPWGERHTHTHRIWIKLCVGDSLVFEVRTTRPRGPHLGPPCSVSNHSLPSELNVAITSCSHRISTRKGERRTQTWCRPADQERVTESRLRLSTLNLPGQQTRGERSNTRSRRGRFNFWRKKNPIGAILRQHENRGCAGQRRQKKLLVFQRSKGNVPACVTRYYNGRSAVDDHAASYCSHCCSPVITSGTR